MMQLGDERPVRFLVHDRNATFCLAFDEIFRSEGIRLIRTPIQAPNANAHAERWVRTLRAEYLDRILILGRRAQSSWSSSPPAPLVGGVGGTLKASSHAASRLGR
jgi:transposase InsO family protein